MALNAKAKVRKPRKTSSKQSLSLPKSFLSEKPAPPLLNLQLITFRAKHAKKPRWLEKNALLQYDAAVLAVYQDYYKLHSISKRSYCFRMMAE